MERKSPRSNQRPRPTNKALHSQEPMTPNPLSMSKMTPNQHSDPNVRDRTPPRVMAARAEDSQSPRFICLRRHRQNSTARSTVTACAACPGAWMTGSAPSGANRTSTHVAPPPALGSGSVSLSDPR